MIYFHFVVEIMQSAVVYPTYSNFDGGNWEWDFYFLVFHNVLFSYECKQCSI